MVAGTTIGAVIGAPGDGIDIENWGGDWYGANDTFSIPTLLAGGVMV